MLRHNFSATSLCDITVFVVTLIMMRRQVGTGGGAASSSTATVVQQLVLQPQRRTFVPDDLDAWQSTETSSIDSEEPFEMDTTETAEENTDGRDTVDPQTGLITFHIRNNESRDDRGQRLMSLVRQRLGVETLQPNWEKQIFKVLPDENIQEPNARTARLRAVHVADDYLLDFFRFQTHGWNSSPIMPLTSQSDGSQNETTVLMYQFLAVGRALRENNVFDVDSTTIHDVIQFVMDRLFLPIAKSMIVSLKVFPFPVTKCSGVLSNADFQGEVYGNEEYDLSRGPVGYSVQPLRDYLRKSSTDDFVPEKTCFDVYLYTNTTFQDIVVTTTTNTNSSDSDDSSEPSPKRSRRQLIEESDYEDDEDDQDDNQDDNQDDEDNVVEADVVIPRIRNPNQEPWQIELERFGKDELNHMKQTLRNAASTFGNNTWGRLVQGLVRLYQRLKSQMEERQCGDAINETMNQITDTLAKLQTIDADVLNEILAQVFNHFQYGRVGSKVIREKLLEDLQNSRIEAFRRLERYRTHPSMERPGDRRQDEDVAIGVVEFMLGGNKINLDIVYGSTEDDEDNSLEDAQFEDRALDGDDEEEEEEEEADRRAKENRSARAELKARRKTLKKQLVEAKIRLEEAKRTRVGPYRIEEEALARVEQEMNEFMRTYRERNKELDDDFEMISDVMTTERLRRETRNDIQALIQTILDLVNGQQSLWAGIRTKYPGIKWAWMRQILRGKRRAHYGETYNPNLDEFCRAIVELDLLRSPTAIESACWFLQNYLTEDSDSSDDTKIIERRNLRKQTLESAMACLARADLTIARELAQEGQLHPIMLLAGRILDFQPTRHKTVDDDGLKQFIRRFAIFLGTQCDVQIWMPWQRLPAKPTIPVFRQLFERMDSNVNVLLRDTRIRETWTQGATLEILETLVRFASWSNSEKLLAAQQHLVANVEFANKTSEHMQLYLAWQEHILNAEQEAESALQKTLASPVDGASDEMNAFLATSVKSPMDHFASTLREARRAMDKYISMFRDSSVENANVLDDPDSNPMLTVLGQEFRAEHVRSTFLTMSRTIEETFAFGMEGGGDLWVSLVKQFQTRLMSARAQENVEAKYRSMFAELLKSTSSTNIRSMASLLVFRLAQSELGTNALFDLGIRGVRRIDDNAMVEYEFASLSGLTIDHSLNMDENGIIQHLQKAEGMLEFQTLVDQLAVVRGVSKDLQRQVMAQLEKVILLKQADIDAMAAEIAVQQERLQGARSVNLQGGEDDGETDIVDLNQPGGDSGEYKAIRNAKERLRNARKRVSEMKQTLLPQWTSMAPWTFEYRDLYNVVQKFVFENWKAMHMPGGQCRMFLSSGRLVRLAHPTGMLCKVQSPPDSPTSIIL